jgi:hypothetical protein
MRSAVDRWAEENGAEIRTVERATIVAISVMRPGAAAYDCTRCWLEGDIALNDPQARLLQKHFENRRLRPVLKASATPLFLQHAMTWPQVRAAARRLGYATAD